MSVVITPAPSMHLFTQTVSVPVANTVTETTVIGAGVGSVTLPPGFFWIGRTFDIHAMGFWTDTANPTVELKAKFGGTTFLDTTAVTVANAVSPAEIFHIDIGFTCITVGTTGSIMGQGYCHFSTDKNIADIMVNFAPMTSATTINTTIAQTVDLTFQWGAADPANSLTVTNLNLMASA